MLLFNGCTQSNAVSPMRGCVGDDVIDMTMVTKHSSTVCFAVTINEASLC